MKRRKARRYCSVFNCLNKDTDPNLTFFGFPKDAERCRQWLTLIDREDLLQKYDDTNMGRYEVCSKHFEDSSIKIIKQLKKDALPSIFLPNQHHGVLSNSESPSTSSQDESNLNASSSSKVHSTSTQRNKEYATVATQTESKLQAMVEQTQMWNSLTAGTPRKRKLLNELRKYKLQR